MPYSGWKLDEGVRGYLLALNRPKFDQVRMDHVTLEVCNKGDTLPVPQPADIKIVGYASNDNIEAYVVSVNDKIVRPDGEIYHITLSFRSGVGVEPKDSKALCKNGWSPLERIIPVETTPVFHSY